MTTHTWFGGTGRFGNPNDWTPNGVPQSGDTAIIETGKVKLANTGQGGVTIDLNGTSADTAPVLSLRNDVLADNIVMTGLQTRFGEIDIHGTVVDKGSMTIGGGRFTGGADLTINIRGNGTLLSEGPITVDLAGVTIKGGTWEANTVTNSGQIMNIDTKVTAGTFTAPPTVFESGFHFGESVAAGVHVVLSGLAVPQEVILDKPLQFLGEIDGFGAGLPNTIDLPNTPFDKVTSESFADNHLELFHEHRELANLNIAGDFTINNFAFSADAGGGTLIRFTHPAAAALSDPSTPTVLVAPS